MPKQKDLKHREKQNIIKRLLIEIPPTNRKQFWPKELKFFNDLYDLFPCNEFWRSIKLSEKTDSLRYYKSEYGLSVIQKKFLEYNYKPKEQEEIILGEKSGEDFISRNKPSTIKQFLDNE